MTATFRGVSRAPDVVVIGGGIMGCSAACFLARAGVSVTMLERAEQVGTQASGRNAGGIRANGRKPAEVPLAMASIQLWEFFRDELGGQFEYEQDGQMYLARNETEMALLRRAATVLTGLGLGVRVVTGPDLRELVPNLSSLIIGGLYCPTDGQVNPILATRFVGRMAAQAGATIQTDTTVTGLESQGGRITGVITNRGRIATGAVVATVGPWANKIAAMVGVTLPLTIRPTWSAVTTPIARLLRPMVSGNTIYIRTTRSGNLMFGGSFTSPVPAAAFDTRSNLSVIRWSMARAMEVFPAMRQTSLLRTWGGTLVNSPDHMLILDTMPGLENMHFATGCTGHGFCLGPIVGKLLSEMTLGMTTSPSVDALRLRRFERQA